MPNINTHKIILCCLVLFFPAATHAQTKADTLEQKFKSEKDSSQKAFMASELIFEVFKTKGDLKLCDYYYRFAKNYGIKNNDLKILTKAYNGKGTVYYYQSHTDSATAFFERAYKLAIEAGEPEIECRTLNNLGSIHYYLGEYQRSLEYYMKGLSKEYESGHEEGTFISLNNIGYVYSSIKAEKKALEYFTKGAKHAFKVNDMNSLIFSYDGIANMYRDVNNYDSSLVYHLKTFSLSQKLNDLNSKMYSALNLGNLYNELDEKSKAIRYLIITVTLAKQFENSEVLASAYAAYVSLHKKDNLKLASAYADTLMTLIPHIKTPSLLKDLYKLKADVEYLKNNKDSAYVYIQKYSLLNDSIYNIEISKSVAELQSRFDVSQKEKQIDVLNEKDKKKQLIIYFTISIGILILGALLYIFYVSRQRQKTNRLLELKNYEISKQKKLVDEKQKEVMDSIHYAKRIQNALMASEKYIEKSLNKLNKD